MNPVRCRNLGTAVSQQDWEGGISRWVREVPLFAYWPKKNVTSLKLLLDFFICRD